MKEDGLKCITVDVLGRTYELCRLIITLWNVLNDVLCQHMSAYVSIRQHTSAYVSIREHTSGRTSFVFRILQSRRPEPSLQHTSAYVSIRQKTRAYVSIRQHTSADQSPVCTIFSCRAQSARSQQSKVTY